MKKFTVHMVETPSFNNREVDVTAEYWYVDAAGALIFMVTPAFRSQEKVAAFGPRQWERVATS